MAISDPGIFFAEFRRYGNDYDACHTYYGAPNVYGAEVLQVHAPFLNEIRRVGRQCQPEQVLYLCCENGYGNSACESHNNGIGNVFYDSAEAQ